MNESCTMHGAKIAVELRPGLTAWAYWSHKRATRSRIYAAFHRALKHGLIRAEAGPRARMTIYFPVN